VNAAMLVRSLRVFPMLQNIQAKPHTWFPKRQNAKLFVLGVMRAKLITHLE